MFDAISVCVSEAAPCFLRSTKPSVQFPVSYLSLQGVCAAVRQAGIQPGPFAGTLSGWRYAVYRPTCDLGQPQ